MANLQFTHHDYEILERTVRFENIFRLASYTLRTRLFKGGWSQIFQREIIERDNAVGVLLYDPVLDRVVLIEQFRAGALATPSSPWIIEIVAGILQSHEKPADSAHREAREEAACEILDLYHICDFFPSPGSSNELVYLFCGRIDASNAQGVHGLIEEQEDIRVLNLSVQEAFDNVRTNVINNSFAIIALQWLKINHDFIRNHWLANDG